MDTTEIMTIGELENHNANLVETNVRCIGDKTTICQIVELLAYIRHILKTSSKDKILVNVGYNISDGQFLFDVNGQQIPDLINKQSVDIN